MKGVSLLLFLNLAANMLAMDESETTKERLLPIFVPTQTPRQKYLEELRVRFIYGESLQPNEMDSLKKHQNGNLGPLLILKQNITLQKLNPEEESLANTWNEIIERKYREAENIKASIFN